MKLWICGQRWSGIEEKGKIAQTCGNEGSARALAASKQKVTATAVDGEQIKRMTRLPYPAQTDPPWMFTCRAEI